LCGCHTTKEGEKNKKRLRSSNIGEKWRRGYKIVGEVTTRQCSTEDKMERGENSQAKSGLGTPKENVIGGKRPKTGLSVAKKRKTICDEQRTLGQVHR